MLSSAITRAPARSTAKATVNFETANNSFTCVTCQSILWRVAGLFHSLGSGYAMTTTRQGRTWIAGTVIPGREKALRPFQGMMRKICLLSSSLSLYYLADFDNHISSHASASFSKTRFRLLLIL